MPHRVKSFVLPLVAAIAFSLTGCGSERSSTSISENKEAQQQQIVGTNGQLIAIQSDNVRAAGYDADSLVMTVQFDNGALYEYHDVPADLWESFISAQPHPWSQVGYPRLVQGGVSYKRVG